MFLNLQKRSQKISTLEEKQGQFWNFYWLSHKVMKRYFQFLSYFSDEARKTNKKVISKNTEKKLNKENMKIVNVSL